MTRRTCAMVRHFRPFAFQNATIRRQRSGLSLTLAVSAAVPPKTSNETSRGFRGISSSSTESLTT